MTAGKIDASNKESGNEAININQAIMEDEAHNNELSDGFKCPESQTKATYEGSSISLYPKYEG